MFFCSLIGCYNETFTAEIFIVFTLSGVYINTYNKIITNLLFIIKKD